ncbi:MAG: glycosyltransferase [Bacteroidia bacterium]
MKNITYIISDIDKAIAFEWIVKHIDSTKINLSFILINSSNSFLEKYLIANKIPVYTINCKNKLYSPIAVIKCKKLLKKLNTDIVHCHLIMANLIGLSAAKLAGIKNRIYTRHHSDFHHIYFPKAVKWDRYCNHLATKIVSISDVVTNILVTKENVSKEKIIKIWHGFDTESFNNPNQIKVNDLKLKYNLNNNSPVIGVISRFTHWKGVQYIIPAYKQFLKEHPNALLLLFNGVGDYELEIDLLLKDLPLTSYKKIYFENDITNLYGVFDVFIHVPISSSVEAFGQTYIECMLSGKPLIATKSGIGNEILINNGNCIEVPHKNSLLIYEALIKLLSDNLLLNNITKNAKNSVIEKFSINEMINKLHSLYLKELPN